MLTSEYITVAEAIPIAFVSITIVFLILLLIAYILKLFKYIFKEQVPVTNNSSVQMMGQKVEQNINENNFVSLNDITNNEEKLLASLVSVIDANKDSEDKKYKITKIKEI